MVDSFGAGQACTQDRGSTELFVNIAGPGLGYKKISGEY
ncbi:hypothetical protein ACP70R_039193 [Stipagrostis hirtigluma subsp. patula]